MRVGAALLVGAGALVGCAAQRSTERVFDGHTIIGPYIEPEAYAAFAEGVYLEEHGDVEGALRAYRRAQASDSDSPAISVRIAALLCASDLDAALSELDTSGIGRDYAPAWVERGRCSQRHGRADEALAAARRAVLLDDANPDANLLVAELLRQRQATDAASAWLFAWLLVDRGAATRHAAIEAEAQQLGDAALIALARSTPTSSQDAAAPTEPNPASATPLARAWESSATDPALALAEARRVLGANPADADALVIALFLAARLGDEQTFGALMREAKPASLPSSSLSPRLVELLRQRAGDAAADAWADAYRARAPQP